MHSSTFDMRDHLIYKALNDSDLNTRFLACRAVANLFKKNGDVRTSSEFYQGGYMETLFSSRDASERFTACVNISKLAYEAGEKDKSFVFFKEAGVYKAEARVHSATKRDYWTLSFLFYSEPPTTQGLKVFNFYYEWREKYSPSSPVKKRVTFEQKCDAIMIPYHIHSPESTRTSETPTAPVKQSSTITKDRAELASLRKRLFVDDDSPRLTDAPRKRRSVLSIENAAHLRTRLFV